MGDLNRLHDMRSLDRSEAYGIMNDMISGALSEVRLSATLASLNHRELQLDEILGFRDAMLEHCAHIDLGLEGFRPQQALAPAKAPSVTARPPSCSTPSQPAPPLPAPRFTALPPPE